MSETIINSKQSLEAYIRHLRTQFDSHKYIRATLKTGKQRTLTQNKALHVYCGLLADTLNEAGYDFRKTIREGIDVPWSPELVKYYMWGPVQKAITGFDSSTKPETHQYGEIYEVLNRHTSQKLGVFVPWPCKDNMNEENKG